MSSASTSAAASDSDEALLARYREAEEEAFATLYQRHKNALYRFVHGLCSSTAQADEVFQETWLAVVRSHAVPGRFKTWLFQIARNRLVDCWRQQKSAAMHNETTLSPTADEKDSPQPETPETLLLRAEQLQHISQAMETLPLQQREVFLLRAHANMELAEIAALTETPLETVKSRYRYALAKLRQFLLSLEPVQKTERVGMEVNTLL